MEQKHSILDEYGSDFKLEHTTDDDLLDETDIKLECPDEEEEDPAQDDFPGGRYEREEEEEEGRSEEGQGEGNEYYDGYDQPTFICYLCNKILKTEKYLEKHLEKHNEDQANVYSCLACDKVFETKVKLKRHIKIHSTIQPVKRVNRNHVLLKCPICDKLLTSKLGLTIHVQRHSSLAQSASEAQQMVSAAASVESTEDSKGAAAENISEFPCLLCHTVFDSKSSLSEHMLCHDSAQRFECPVCNKRYTTKGGVTVHMRVHSEDDRPHACGVCGKRFRAKGNMTEHARIHESERPFACKYCDKAFKQRSNLTVHLLLTHGERTPRRGEPGSDQWYGDAGFTGSAQSRGVLQCRVCQKILTSKRGLQIHMKLHMLDDCVGARTGGVRIPSSGMMSGAGAASSKPRVQYECVICGKFLATKYSLDKHVQLHAPDQSLIECGVCGRQFRSMKNMLLHIRMHTGERPYACTRCDKRYTQRSNLITHSLLAHGERVEWRKINEMTPVMPSVITLETVLPSSQEGTYDEEHVSYEHLCSVCAKQFKTRDQLVMHEKIHAQSYAQVCDDCNHTFANAEELRLHKETCQSVRAQATDERPYRCNMCSAAFSYSFSLNAHMRKHSNEQPSHACVKCRASFVDAFALKRHERMHCSASAASERLHRCWVCSKMFANRPALLMHMRTHAEDKPLVCAECGARFISKNLLRMHQRIHTNARTEASNTQTEEYSETTEDGSQVIIYEIMR